MAITGMLPLILATARFVCNLINERMSGIHNRCSVCGVGMTLVIEHLLRTPGLPWTYANDVLLHQRLKYHSPCRGR